MIANVRFKVQMRLDQVLNEVTAELKAGSHAWENYIAAQRDPAYALRVRAYYRGKLVRALPGCRITFRPRQLLIHLPKNYPRAEVPITHEITQLQSTAFSPAAYRHKPQIGV